jgi:hypothetical protein
VVEVESIIPTKIIEWYTKSTWFLVHIGPMRYQFAGQAYITHKKRVMLRSPEKNRHIMFLKKMGHEIFLLQKGHISDE